MNTLLLTQIDMAALAAQERAEENPRQGWLARALAAVAERRQDAFDALQERELAGQPTRFNECSEPEQEGLASLGDDGLVEFYLEDRDIYVRTPRSPKP